jgi:hypothetical protein
MAPPTPAAVAAALTKEPLDTREQAAAKTIQRAALPRLIGDHAALQRKPLLERLELELELQRGLRLLMLCFCMFAAVIYASILESQAPVRLGLLNTYKSLFSLDDSLADVKTSNDLMEYLSMISQQARLIQPVSSAYFVEESGGELKILSGLHRFVETEILESPQIQPRVDSPSWSLMAWVQLPENGGANVLRKPLGKTPDEAKLSCWSWYVGSPNDRFDFGAHDFRGGTFTSEMQESVVSTFPNGSAIASAAADGELHNVALVVTPANITFYMDAKIQSTVNISRPVTDCSGLTLELGDADLPTLGEVTFFARELTQGECGVVLSVDAVLSTDVTFVNECE